MYESVRVRAYVWRSMCFCMVGSYMILRALIINKTPLKRGYSSKTTFVSLSWEIKCWFINYLFLEILTVGFLFLFSYPVHGPWNQKLLRRRDWQRGKWKKRHSQKKCTNNISERTKHHLIGVQQLYPFLCLSWESVCPLHPFTPSPSWFVKSFLQRKLFILCVCSGGPHHTVASSAWLRRGAGTCARFSTAASRATCFRGK